MTKIIITADPRTGKSTLLAKIIANATEKQGFVTHEVKNINNRVGFDIITANRTTYALARTDFSSAYRVSKYGVDIAAVDSAVEAVSSFTKKDMLYIDEIGQMQLFSKTFPDLVRNYLNSQNTFVGTLCTNYDCEFIREIKKRGDVEFIHLTVCNRNAHHEQLPERITATFK